MNTMNYRGFTARIDFDERNNLFVGRLIGTRDIVSFHGDSVRKLRSAFIAAVKEYVADCEALGVAPVRESSGKILLRLPPSLHGQAALAAQTEGVSLNQWVNDLVERAVGQR